MVSAALISPIRLPAPASPGPASLAAAAASTAAPDPRLQAAKDALAKLKTLPAQAKATQSGLARDKLEALRQRLKMLLMLGGDPKVLAREAAQIAKEIGQAAKDYAAASGGSDAGATASAEDGAAAPQAAKTAQDAAGDRPTDTATNAKDPASPRADGAALAPKATGQPDAPQNTAPSPDAKVNAAPSVKGPDPVIEEARALTAKAKALLKAALQQMKADHRDDPNAKSEQDKVDQADKDIEEAARTLAAENASSGYAADGTATAPSADPGPAISVKA